jgi:hypothetical protein
VLYRLTRRSHERLVTRAFGNRSVEVA